ncbi:MAG: PTS transporter subunit EIIB, partial [Erysipelotrichaceae bacterium]|nr:PTS transporter subunit EIIB [Erysipelotrichaceae bacterium]
MTNKELAEIILEKAGGTSNIRDAANCMTRLRMHLNDPSKLSQADLENTEGVLGVVFDGDYLQVILGPGTAKKVADEVLLILGPSHSSNFAGDWEANKEKTKAKQKKGGIQDLLKTIAGIFVPLIPAIIAAGLFNGFASLIGQLLKDGT